MRHAHMLHSQEYSNEMLLVCGHIPPHDDSMNDRTPGGVLDNCWSNLQPLPIASAHRISTSQLPDNTNQVGAEMEGMVFRDGEIGFILRLCGKYVALVMGSWTGFKKPIHGVQSERPTWC